MYIVSSLLKACTFLLPLHVSGFIDLCLAEWTSEFIDLPNYAFDFGSNA